MKSKKLFFVLSAVVGLLFSACNHKPEYKLTGKITGEVQGKAYLTKIKDNKLVKVDSVSLKNGMFSFTGAVKTPEFYLVQFPESRKYTIPLFLENENITINADIKKINEAKVKGSVNNEVMTAFQKIRIPHETETSARFKAYLGFKKVNDTVKMDSIENVRMNAKKVYKGKVKKFLEKNSNTIAGAYLTSGFFRDEKLKDIEEIYNLFTDNAKNSIFGVDIKEQIDKMKKVAIGQMAPDFTLNTPEGKPLKMSSFKGKILVIDFWASWCGPCRHENPNMVKMYKKLHRKGVEFLGVSLDNKADLWKKAIKADKLPWPQVSDLKGWASSAAKLYNIKAIPSPFIIGRDGKIVAKDVRGKDLKTTLIKLLGK